MQIKTLMSLPALPLFILLMPYISHYYLLEDKVQKMYGQYVKNTSFY